MIGERLRHYRVDAEIGAGAMGIVYRAFDTVLERPVAIKILSERPDQEIDGARLVDEARNVSALNHPNICTIHDVGEDHNRTFIVMEFIEGQPLTHLLLPDGLNVDSIVNFGGQIADALNHAHDRGIIHPTSRGTTSSSPRISASRCSTSGSRFVFRKTWRPAISSSEPTVERTR